MNQTGFIHTQNNLSIRQALKSLDYKIRILANYNPKSIWEMDNAYLPWYLRIYRNKLRKFAQTVLSPYVLQLDVNPHSQYEEQVLKKAALSGLLSDLLPYPFGSLNPLYFIKPLQLIQSIKIEELSAVCAGMGIMIGAHALGTMPILLSGQLDKIKNLILPMYKKNKSGNPFLMAFAITEPAAGSDVEDSLGAKSHKPQTKVKPTQGGWILNGRKIFISGGSQADAVTVFASVENEGMESWTCFYVERGMKGFSVVRDELKMGQRTSAASELLFEDVFIPDSHVIGKLRHGWAINRSTLNFSRIPVGAVALGIARGAMESSIQFACQTQLGGKPLMEYQETQLQIAQMIMDVTAMRALIWQSASKFTPTQARASIAKAYCSDLSVKVCQNAMELMGNHGFLHSNTVEKHFRDARLTQIYEGTNQINRLAIIEDYMEIFTNLMERKDD